VVPLFIAAQPQTLKDLKSMTQDDPCKRLLLPEILLEEYECLSQPRNQEIEAGLRAIRDQIKEHRDDADFAEALEGKIVSDIYKLMARAQKIKANEACADLFEDWEKKFDSGLIARDTLGKRAVERATVAEIFGRLADIRAGHKDEAEKAKSAAERKKITDSEILEALDESEEEATEWEAGSKGTGSGRTKKIKDVSLADAEKKVAQTLRSALCLSGGGIRSAIFNLGILQGLARHGLLEKFDYLSTVSGGGFSGGWLSAWIYRDGLDSVIEQLAEPPKSSLEPEPPPVEHLRIYSNYLSPQPGLLSADTWTLVATFLRNLALNWIVFIPMLVVFLLGPRIWAAILFRSAEYEQYAHYAYVTAGMLAGWVSLTYIGWHLPSTSTYESNPRSEGYKSGQGPFISWCLIWMTISAAAFAVFFWLRLGSAQPEFGLGKYVALTEGIIAVPWLIVILKVCSIPESRSALCRVAEKRRARLAWKLIAASLRLSGATLLIAIAQFVTAYLLRYTTVSLLPRNPERPLAYATFAVPIILLLMSVGGTLIAGFISRFTNDTDQEWWARAGAWMFIVIVSWIVIHLLVLYGPLMILTLGSTYRRIQAIGLRNLPWSDLAKISGTVIGVLSGIITLLGGFSGKTPANAKEAQRSGLAGMAVSALTILVAPIFLAFVFVLLALATDRLLVTSIGQWVSSYSWLGGVKLPSPSGSLSAWHCDLIQATPVRYLLAFGVSLTILAAIMGRLISTNNFSLQYMWRNRIVRACLGASRRRGTRRPNPFTGFDTYDNLLMHELRSQSIGVPPPERLRGRPDDDHPYEPKPHKLFHVLNLALNLTGGKKLQWQDRRAESFTVSPLHSGSYWLGYRRSCCYGGEQGISLGAAIAISGAFASPNMGYMMTSPVVRFLMTLFNIRFGAWLGNPGPAGEKANIIERITNVLFRALASEKDLRPFRLRSPGLSVMPIVSEAFGSVDDESPYVYLSDGGHFENLGLYEMVLRRCRFIVVCDASTDPQYSFESLAIAVRQIRIDLGIPIDIADLRVGEPSQNLKGKYCAIGKIRYSCVDRRPNDPDTTDEDFDGDLIYIKPSLIGAEPRDVINYWQGSNGFPQETITDQWFSEAQFESYRALGMHIIDAICDPNDLGARSQISLAAFGRKAYEHNRLDFRAFQEDVGYLALETLSKETIGKYDYPSYKSKVKKFIDDLLE
jgi:hypothetical protein